MGNDELNNANLCTIFLRKKYKCCLLWLLTIISTTQLSYIIFDKIDTSLIENLAKRFLDMTNNTTAP